MNMQMRHTLAACQTLIDADVVAIRLMAFVKDLLGLSQRAQQSDLLLFCGIEQRGKVALGNDYGMSRRNGKAIFVNHSEIVFGKNARGIENAERAGFGGHGVGTIQERFDVRAIILMRHGKRKNPRLGVCRTLVVDRKNRARRGCFLPDSPPHGCSKGQRSRSALARTNPAYPLRVQETGKKRAGAVDFSLIPPGTFPLIPPGTLQPTIPKSDRLLAEKTIFPVRFCWRCRLYGGGAIRYHSVSLYQPIL